jgi:hypothetical protein
MADIAMATKVQKLLNLFQASRNFTVMFLVTCRFANRDIKFQNGRYCYGNQGAKIVKFIPSLKKLYGNVSRHMQICIRIVFAANNFKFILYRFLPGFT